METKEFIEKTIDIVNFLVNAAGQDNYMAAARIVTKQAEMDCDGLIEECDEVITKMEKMRNELLAIRQEAEKTRQK